MRMSNPFPLAPMLVPHKDAYALWYTFSVQSISLQATQSTPNSTDAPWWAWIGGALGALYVIDAIIFAPLLGAATLTGVFVCSQVGAPLVLLLKQSKHCTTRGMAADAQWGL